MPCNCGKGRSTVPAQSTANFSQANIQRAPITAVRPPSNQVATQTPSGRPVINRAVRQLPLGVSRLVQRQVVRR
jgi:hypothetical protein